jgi:hypothetical protein
VIPNDNDLVLNSKEYDDYDNLMAQLNPVDDNVSLFP